MFRVLALLAVTGLVACTTSTGPSGSLERNGFRNLSPSERQLIRRIEDSDDNSAQRRAQIRAILNR